MSVKARFVPRGRNLSVESASLYSRGAAARRRRRDSVYRAPVPALDFRSPTPYDIPLSSCTKGSTRFVYLCLIHLFGRRAIVWPTTVILGFFACLSVTFAARCVRPRVYCAADCLYLWHN